MTKLFASCLAVLVLTTAPPAQAQAPSAPTFRPLSDLAVFPQRDAPAQAVALNRTQLAAELSARILSTHAEPGERVGKGQVLVRLDARDYRLALERARAQLAAAQARLSQAEAQLRRTQGLRERNFVSSEALQQRETEVDVVRADLAVAANAVDVAQRNVDKCVLRAPYDAVVRTRDVSAGSLAAPGTLLMTLEDARRVEVSARVSPRDLDSLRSARDIAFVSPAGRQPVRVNRVSPAIDDATRTHEVRAAFVGERAPSGADGRLQWTESAAHVPGELLVRRGKELGIFVARDGVARFVPLPGAQEGRPAAIGLASDTRIAVDGRNSLTDGQAVR